MFATSSPFLIYIFAQFLEIVDNIIRLWTILVKINFKIKGVPIPFIKIQMSIRSCSLQNIMFAVSNTKVNKTPFYLLGTHTSEVCGCNRR